MKIEELKEQIINKKVNSSFKIFKYTDDKFLCYQYIEAISKILNKQINYLEDITQLENINDDFFGESNSLFILSIDTLEKQLPKTDLSNCIIICKNIKINVDESLIIEFPKLVDWQIKDYLKVKANNLTQDKIDWLYNITNGNIYRLENEIDKISIFDKEEQPIIFEQINNDDGYSDLCPYSIFDFTNAIIKKDYNKITEIFINLEKIDVEPYGVVTLLLKNFKYIINIQQNRNCSAEQLNISQKQFNAIKWNCGKYTNNELIKIYKFLTDFDYKLKSGYLDLSRDSLISYIVLNIV